MDLPNFKANHVIAKFRNLRSFYMQELKKVKQSEESGDVYTPRVFWWDKMDSFLKPHVQPRKKDFSADKSDWVELDIAKPTDLEAEEDSKKREHSHLAKRSRTEDTQEKSIAQTLKEIQSNLQVLTSRDNDCFESFGKHVASLLRTLPAAKALALQPHVVSLITGEMGGEPELAVPQPERTIDGMELEVRARV